MKRPDLLANLYLANAALLITHEIDSAFWQEWDLFGIPGGIQVFLILNLLIVLVLLYGQPQVIRCAPSARWYALLSAAGGLFAFGIHSYFLATGHPQFRLPVSLAILGLTLVVSLGLAGVVVGRDWKIGGLGD